MSTVPPSPGSGSSAPSSVPVSDSWWVVPGVLLAGPHPGTGREAQVRQLLRALLAAGILLFLDLTAEGERAAYDLLLVEESAALGVECTYVRFPVPAGGVPTPELARRVVATMSLSMSRGRPVYVHGAGSTGRTGTLVGCWLREQGNEAGDVFWHMDRLRAATPSAADPSPATEEQRAFVAGWPHRG